MTNLRWIIPIICIIATSITEELFRIADCFTLSFSSFISLVRPWSRDGQGRQEEQARRLLLHQLVGLPARTGEIFAAKHQSLPVHSPHLRLRWLHQRFHPSTFRQVAGHRPRSFLLLN